MNGPIAKISCVVACAALLTACSTKEQSGQLLGGATGAAVGSLFGSGGGKVVAVGAGAVLGTIAGGAIGKNQDEKGR